MNEKTRERVGQISGREAGAGDGVARAGGAEALPRGV